MTVIAFGSQSEGCPARHPRRAGRSPTGSAWPGYLERAATTMGIESIIIIVFIVLIVLFVMGYFGRGRRA
jgi:hypothetical protein